MERVLGNGTAAVGAKRSDEAKYPIRRNECDAASEKNRIEHEN